MYWKLSVFTSTIAAMATVYDIVRVGQREGPSLLASILVFSVVATLLVGPHLVFAALAVWLRSHRVLSVILLVIVLVVSLSGVSALAVDTNAYLDRDQTFSGGQRMWPFLIGLAQWLAAVLTSAILLLAFYFLKQTSSAVDTAAPK